MLLEFKRSNAFAQEQTVKKPHKSQTKARTLTT